MNGVVESLLFALVGTVIAGVVLVNAANVVLPWLLLRRLGRVLGLRSGWRARLYGSYAHARATRAVLVRRRDQRRGRKLWVIEVRLARPLASRLWVRSKAPNVRPQLPTGDPALDDAYQAVAEAPDVAIRALLEARGPLLDARALGEVEVQDDHVTITTPDDIELVRPALEAACAIARALEASAARAAMSA